MTPAIPISEALVDRNLLGAALGDVTSWQTWVTILKAAFAEALTAEESALFAVVAGDRAPPSGGCVSCGAARSADVRQVPMAAAVAVHIAALTDHRKRLVPGEIGTVAVIAASREQASTVFNYVRDFLTASRIAGGPGCQHRPRRDMLHGDICISVVTNSFRGARGMTLLAVIGDEVSYWSDESFGAA